MNEPIASVTEGPDTLNVVRNPIANTFGFWVERRNPDSTIDMSSVTWLSESQTLDLAIALLKETA